MKLQSGETLRALMKQRHKSNQDVADVAGCSRQFVSQLANGHRTSCSDDVAISVARCLGVNLDVLFVPAVSAVRVSSARTSRRG